MYMNMIMQKLQSTEIEIKQQRNNEIVNAPIHFYNLQQNNLENYFESTVQE